jgi:ABC-2 type transport system ATP-binding protein
MIEVENLSKRYGEKLAVDGLSFVVQPGIVTGFLGPNGAGKPVTDLRLSFVGGGTVRWIGRRLALAGQCCGAPQIQA